jgi:hypothetical protein
LRISADISLLNQITSGTGGTTDISTINSLSSSLDLKANLNGNTYTGTHDFTDSTILGLTGSSTIADGSLTIAKTNGLQTTLNNKMPLLFPVARIASGVVQTTHFSLNSSHYNKMIFWLSGASLTISVPSPIGVPDGTWMGLTTVSNGSTTYSMTITPVSDQNSLGQFNATNSASGAGGGTKSMVCISGAWRWFS